MDVTSRAFRSIACAGRAAYFACLLCAGSIAARKRPWSQAVAPGPQGCFPLNVEEHHALSDLQDELDLWRRHWTDRRRDRIHQRLTAVPGNSEGVGKADGTGFHCGKGIPGWRRSVATSMRGLAKGSRWWPSGVNMWSQPLPNIADEPGDGRYPIAHNVYYVIDSHGCIIKLDALCRCLLSQGSRRWLFNFNRSACF